MTRLSPIHYLFHRRCCRACKVSQSRMEQMAQSVNGQTRTFASENIGENKTYRVAVEGNIASGKTSLLNYFANVPKVQVLAEPVNKWRNVYDHNTLDLMYKDPKRWSLTFQTYVQLTMLDLHLQPAVKPVTLMERSIYSARYCFVENLFNSGYMPDVEYTVLCEWFNWLKEYHGLNLDLIVYLRTTPEICLKRIQERSRTEETKIKMDYLTKLHDLHEDWLIRQDKFKAPAPVIILDANSDLTCMESIYDEHRDEILCSL